ncbi:hypothetical protein D9758_012668 [Tetrapyrgos nigripes]|uniref:Uncharacterized protein n=1 Tax=Tetrapyrgos nigripes TaxID=182062 RepID=A0A8H5LMW0_9AGAR|nr:hypothetical protein D9758_012668 [Tetrapyrgos nigripes]
MPNPMDAIYKVEADATSTPAINLHKILGPRIIGAWLNLMLYVLVIDRALHYFQHYPTDKILLKITVFATLGWDTAMTVASCADVYLNAVIFQAAIERRSENNLLINLLFGDGRTQSIYLASTGISGAIVQTFMLHRYWALYLTYSISDQTFEEREEKWL